MIRENIKDWNLLLKGVAFLIAVLAFMAIKEIEKAQRENQALMESIEHLENSFEAEREDNLLELGRLEQQVSLQQEINTQLKQEILNLEKQKNQLNSEAHEKKMAIARITAIDSIRHAISRHYRP